MDATQAARLYTQASWKLTLAVVASSVLLAYPSFFGQVALLWTLVPWFSGLADLARAKGRSSWLALAGVLYVAGLILLLIMPARPLNGHARHELA